jgi:hypothetical protein
LAGLPAGAVACHAAADPSASTPVPGNRMMEWVPQTPGNTYVEDYYATMWQGVGTGGDLPDRVNARVLLVQGNDLRRPMAAGELFGSKSPRPLNSVNLYPLLQQLPPGSIYWPLRDRAWPRKLYEFSSSPYP